MRETGTIIRIKNGRAVVQLEYKNGCKTCQLNSNCKITGTGNRELELSVKGMDFNPGDRVAIETPAKSLLTAAFLVFIFPLILSFLTYLIIYSFTKNSGYGLLGFFICFILSEVLLSWIDKLFGRSRFFEPTIVGRIE